MPYQSSNSGAKRGSQSVGGGGWGRGSQSSSPNPPNFAAALLSALLLLPLVTVPIADEFTTRYIASHAPPGTYTDKDIQDVVDYFNSQRQLESEQSTNKRPAAADGGWGGNSHGFHPLPSQPAAGGGGWGRLQFSHGTRRDDPAENKVYVGNLPPGCTKSQLTALFRTFGQIIGIFINSHKQFAFVTFSNPADATKALAEAKHVFVEAGESYEIRVDVMREQSSFRTGGARGGEAASSDRRPAAGGGAAIQPLPNESDDSSFLFKTIMRLFEGDHLPDCGILPPGVQCGINTWLIPRTSFTSYVPTRYKTDIVPLTHDSFMSTCNMGLGPKGFGIYVRVFIIAKGKWLEMIHYQQIPLGSTVLIVLVKNGKLITKDSSWSIHKAHDQRLRGNDFIAKQEKYGGSCGNLAHEQMTALNPGIDEIEPNDVWRDKYSEPTSNDLSDIFSDLMSIPEQAVRTRPPTIDDCRDVKTSCDNGTLLHDGRQKCVTISEESRKFSMSEFYISPHTQRELQGLTPSLDLRQVTITSRSGILPNGEHLETKPELQLLPPSIPSTKQTKVGAVQDYVGSSFCIHDVYFGFEGASCAECTQLLASNAVEYRGKECFTKDNGWGETVKIGIKRNL